MSKIDLIQQDLLTYKYAQNGTIQKDCSAMNGYTVTLHKAHKYMFCIRLYAICYIELGISLLVINFQLQIYDAAQANNFGPKTFPRGSVWRERRGECTLNMLRSIFLIIVFLLKYYVSIEMFSPETYNQKFKGQDQVKTKGYLILKNYVYLQINDWE